MNKINLKGVEMSTWIRTLVLLAALINQALVVFGVTDNEADVDTLTQYVSLIFTFVSSVWSWWKNNSFTVSSQKADEKRILNSNSKG